MSSPAAPATSMSVTRCCRLRSTDLDNDLALGSANATSAATAQAARLAALAHGNYPAYWPETIRGLITQPLSGRRRWRPSSMARPDGPGSSTTAATLRMGSPIRAGRPHSGRNAVTLVTQDEFVPFQGDDFGMRIFRLHRLPWPDEVLRSLGEAGGFTPRHPLLLHRADRIATTAGDVATPTLRTVCASSSKPPLNRSTISSVASTGKPKPRRRATLAERPDGRSDG